MRKVLIQAECIKIENGDLVVVVFVDDIVLIVETEEDLKNTASVFLKEGKEIGLNNSEVNTIYVIISRQKIT